MASGIFAIVLLLMFLGIVIWAYSGKRKKDFNEAAQLPLDNDDKPAASAKNNKGEQ
ncbi:MAG: cbb3-type cytochrome c oxidase subunit 3 [Spiribacter sp.]|jgi:cytochrome c oxidase cbb3-type subunit 4|nr:cbb3-type cytochrome c oxidase subunit 3 [Spiribacter sp.]MDR9489810.1 cbb3-type cytochrome c oxidase subunit 3 [Spiribacter sp.]